ncbi:MAG: hypothetical protein HW380_772 [Magnetococcales bacterium]|nr:hypothetical protein [Magnetococcales bacterium]
MARIRAELPPDWEPFPGAEAETLAEALKTVISALDYSLLNDRIEPPTDENLARWVWKNLDVPGLESVGIQSTRDQGADLNGRDHAHIWRRFRFEAAHRLPNVAQDHPCGRMHGHGFEVILHAHQNLRHSDMGVDFDHLQQVWNPFHDLLHHRCLNELPGLENPTSEMLSAWIWQRLRPKLPELSWVSVYETVSAGCHFDGHHYRIWKEQRFEAALRLARSPANDPRQVLHGHSYLLRLHLSAPLNTVMGWTVDYGDVKRLFHPLYAQLDHNHLNEVQGMADADLKSLLYWIRSGMTDRLAQLDRIDLYDIPGRGAMLCWGNAGPVLPG